jgi:hypothetical protein
MARLVILELGVDRLTEDIGNPVAFCRLYDEAARGSDRGAPTFSAGALRFLTSLESKYIRDSGR